ncbi:MAG: hypothetical protein QOJ01_1457 [Solirubrobacterales bacterium]|nr:hypothetical protein [Solirubrobacterales bacterium]
MTRPAGPRGRLRKRWRYVAAFSDELMVCAARVAVGPLGQTFWAVLDRSTGQLVERTRIRLPGTLGEVAAEEPGGACGPSEVRINSSLLRGALRLADGTPWEATCRTAEGGEVWTRKRTGVAVHGELEAADGRRWSLDGLGVIDETDGYHPRHTVWSWSAGVGQTSDGRAAGWNLVEGVNDPEHGSERAVWLDGVPSEIPPVEFNGLSGAAFADGSRLDFAAEAERRRSENKLLVRYSYRQPFGTFTGTLPGGVELASGIGVMEHHDAWW